MAEALKAPWILSSTIKPLLLAGCIATRVPQPPGQRVCAGLAAKFRLALILSPACPLIPCNSANTGHAINSRANPRDVLRMLTLLIAAGSRCAFQDNPHACQARLANPDRHRPDSGYRC